MICHFFLGTFSMLPLSLILSFTVVCPEWFIYHLWHASGSFSLSLCLFMGVCDISVKLWITCLQITYANSYIFPLYFSRIYYIQVLTFNLYFHVCWLFLCLFHLFILSSGILEFFIWFWTYLPWFVSMILLFLCIYTYVTFLP